MDYNKILTNIMQPIFEVVFNKIQLLKKQVVQLQDEVNMLNRCIDNMHDPEFMEALCGTK